MASAAPRCGFKIDTARRPEAIRGAPLMAATIVALSVRYSISSAKIHLASMKRHQSTITATLGPPLLRPEGFLVPAFLMRSITKSTKPAKAIVPAPAPSPWRSATDVARGAVLLPETAVCAPARATDVSARVAHHCAATEAPTQRRSWKAAHASQLKRRLVKVMYALAHLSVSKAQ